MVGAWSTHWRRSHGLVHVSSGFGRAALSVQNALNTWNESAVEPFQVRIGISAGEPIAEGDDLFGSVVNLASACVPGRLQVGSPCPPQFANCA